MIITEKCLLKKKTEVLIELVRIHERLAYVLEEECEYGDAVCETEELVECLGFEFELPLDDDEFDKCSVVTTELMSIISELSKEIENKDLKIHYDKTYYNKEEWIADRIWG